jgi:hypothetical protein
MPSISNAFIQRSWRKCSFHPSNFTPSFHAA